MSIVNMKREHLLIRQSSDLETCTGRLPHMPVIPLPSMSKHHISRLTTTADDHTIRRRESLFKATLQTTDSLDIRNSKRSKRHLARYDLHGILSKDSSRATEVDEADSGWANTSRRGTTFHPQYLSTSNDKTWSDTGDRRRSVIQEGQVYNKHLNSGNHFAADPPGDMVKSTSNHSLVPLGKQQYQMGSQQQQRHPVRLLRKMKSFPQLVKKISMVNMLSRHNHKHDKRVRGELSRRNSGKLALERFRRAGRMIQLLLRAVDDIKRVGKKKQIGDVLEQSVTVLPVGVESPLKNSGLMFNPADFKARKKCQMSPEAKKILSKIPGTRTPDEIRVVQSGLHSTMEAYAEFPVKMQESLAKAAWYESFEPNRVIIRQGHRAETYYLILSGTAVVTVSSSEYGITGDPGIKHVAFLKKGNSFGDLTLMHHAQRTATVVCKDTVELIAIDREDFIDIFMHRDAVGRPEFIQFVHTIPELQGWPFVNLPDNNPTVCLFTYFRRGVVICKDSNESDWIYVIKSGGCRVLKKLTAPTELFEARSALLDVFELTDNSATGVSKSPLYSPREGDGQGRHHRTTSYPHRKSKPARKMSVCNSIKLPQITVSAQPHYHSHRALQGMESKLHMDLPNHPITPKDEDREDKMVYLQMQKLSQKDVFGLQPIIFSGNHAPMSVTLVSDGAECVLISKRHFLQHFTATHRSRLEKSMRPYPSEESLRHKLEQQTTWEQYKCRTMHNAIISHSKANEIHSSKVNDNLISKEPGPKE